MKTIEVLGTGCPKCKKLMKLTEQAVAEMELEAEVVKVEDIQAIVARGVMMTPGLVVDGALKSSGRIPPMEELKKMIG